MASGVGPSTTPSPDAPRGFYKVPIDRAFADKLWAVHILTGKSVSRIVGEALATALKVTEEEVAALKSDDRWVPRTPRGGPGMETQQA